MLHHIKYTFLVRFVESQIYGIGAHDLPTYAAVVMGGLFVVTVAALIAGRRVAGIPLSDLD